MVVNYYADPYAVRELLDPATPEHGIPRERFYLLPLDVTTSHELPFPFYQANVDPTFKDTKHPSDPQSKPPLVHFISTFFERAREVMISFGKDTMELHDIVAVWFAIENAPPPEGVVSQSHLNAPWKVAPRRFDVERYVQAHRAL